MLLYNAFAEFIMYVLCLSAVEPGVCRTTTDRTNHQRMEQFAS